MISPVAMAARYLIKAGYAGEDLVAALADIEASCIAVFGRPVMAEFPQSYSVERKRSPGAERQARYRANLKAKAEGVTTVTRDVTSDGSDVTGVTSDGKPSRTVTGDARHYAPRAGTNIDSSPSLSEKPEKSVFVDPVSLRGAPSPVTSRVTFDAFITAYPGNEGMSRLKAQSAWNALSDEDRARAVDALPAFRLWAGKQPVNYTLLHAHNYLGDRRFDNFAQAAKPELVKPQVFVRQDTPAWSAWKAHLAAQGKQIPVHNGGWYFPTEFPPDDERQMNMRLLRQVS